MQEQGRRDFIKRVGATALFSAAGAGLYYAGYKGIFQKSIRSIPSVPNFGLKTIDNSFPAVVSCRGKDPVKLVNTLFEKLGGMARFVAVGDRVLIKPNVSWDRTPEMGATTSPAVVEAVVAKVKAAGAKEILVSDVCINTPERCFDHSGIRVAAQRAGGIVHIPSEKDLVVASLSGVILKDWPVIGIMLKMDKVINIAPVKHHSLSLLTAGMKNWYGAIGGRRNMLHQDINNSIADLAAAFRPTLTIIDATRILFKNGPQGGSTNDVKPGPGLAGGLDQVALDAYAAEVLGVAPEKIPYLAMGQQKGIGNINFRNNAFVECEAV